MQRIPSKLKKHYNIILHQGGLGDLIGQLPAIMYILTYYTNIIIHLYVHDYAVSFCNKVFSKYTRNIHINGVSSLRDKMNEKYLARTPYLHVLSNLSFHITDHAFLTLAHKQVTNEHKNYIKLDPIDVSEFNLPEKYVVITTGFTSETREWIPESVNGVTEYVIKKGYTPVYIGKSFSSAMVTAKSNIGSKGNFKCDYSKGIDLIDMTDLLQAHSIMGAAKAVVGLDNGLLHLACMSDVPVVYGFTTVDPKHRLPYRNNTMGHLCYLVELTKQELSCIGCQSHMNFAPPTHSFTTCMYNDFACTSMLTSDKWIEQLEKIL